MGMLVLLMMTGPQAMGPRALLLALLLLHFVLVAFLRAPMVSHWIWPPSRITAHMMHDRTSCAGRYVYVYELPERFNVGLLSNCSKLRPWEDLCSHLSNDGLGPVARWPRVSEGGSGVFPAKPWHTTDQFSGEVLYHMRLLEHPCTTSHPTLATAFYVPFYAGLDVGRNLWEGSTRGERDALSLDLVQWLANQPQFKKHGGWDHFLMMGRITWDFRRSADDINGWGSNLLYLREMANVTRLLIEQNWFDDQDVGVPYPTGFHPRTDSEIEEWQSLVRSSPRETLFSFAGGMRSKIPNDFRVEILSQCYTSTSCASLDCSHGMCEQSGRVDAVMELFLGSVFCLQPRGDSFTRRSIFDSLLAGCIPVFFWNQSAYLQYPWHLPQDPMSYSVFISKDNIRRGTSIEKVLREIPFEVVRQMQENVIRLIPKIVYAAPGQRLQRTGDAFDIALQNVVQRIRHNPAIAASEPVSFFGPSFNSE